MPKLFPLAILLLGLTCSCLGQVSNGTVIRISDGDTITALLPDNKQLKVRIAGIDAPETGQAFGAQAKQNLSNLIYGRYVTIIYHKTDRYGNFVGRVLLSGSDVGLQQIVEGYAWHFKMDESEMPSYERRAYATAEIEARAEKTGIWSNPDPVAPWVFRKEGDDPVVPANSAMTPSARPQTLKSTPTPQPKTTSRALIRGPRGGCYYVNSKGSKTYVDRSLCN